MAKKSQIYIAARAQDVLGALRPDESLSGRVNAALDRYGAIIERATPSLTEAEWQMVRTACGVWATTQEPAEILLGGIAAEIEDAAAPGGDLEGQDVRELLAKLESMSAAEQMAVIESIERE